MALFESYERRIDQINKVLNSYGISSIEEAEKITKDAGLDVYNQIKGIQPICFENACWAYIVGAAIAIKKNCRKASEAAAAIGRGGTRDERPSDNQHLQPKRRTKSQAHRRDTFHGTIPNHVHAGHAPTRQERGRDPHAEGRG